MESTPIPQAPPRGQKSLKQDKRLFSLGSVLNHAHSYEARQLSDALCWLISIRNKDGTWGGSESLDVFISTCHAVMTLLSAGFSPSSEFISSSLNYLATIDKDKNISFFWRCGPLLNIQQYDDIVRQDIEYMWRYKRRVAVHKDYPVPFFLLKLIRFKDDPQTLSVSENEVLGWILEDYEEDNCWYGRVSITSMALALIYDMEFDRKDEIIDRCVSFILSHCQSAPAQAVTDCGNLVEDFFVIYNLCERDFFENRFSWEIWEHFQKRIPELLSLAGPAPQWSSPPPFGGAIGQTIYPTAVAIRAFLSFFSRVDGVFINQLSLHILENLIARRVIMPAQKIFGHPFWGVPKAGPPNDYCFILMPFQPKLSQIYERYVKRPIEAETTLKCYRADDIFESSQIMKDVWDMVCNARIVIADLTTRNANVYYELGLAHALGKKVILITQNIDEVPFDLKPVRIIAYEDSPEGFETLSKRVVQFVAKELSA